ncbi:MAG: hypothetical protein H6834_12085 [Planctomycetes bacterium]|nr:hypothetical protein [Planctomycetota bacterium]
MLKSLLLALFVFVLAALCAWAVVHWGRKARQPERKLRRLRVGFLVGGLLFGTYAFFADYFLRQTTLFECVLEGSAGAEGETLRTASFTLEHAHVEHTLLVEPKLAPLEEAQIPIHLRILLANDAGETWIDERHVFELRRETSSRGVTRAVWDAHTFRFTPEALGKVRLSIVIEEPGVHGVHVRVEDPEKTDGERAPGY